MKQKYTKTIYDALEQMQLNDSFNKENFILEHWEDYNFFTDRSFCVLLCKVRKLFPAKKFLTLDGNIVRIE